MNYNIVKTHKLLDQRMAIIVRDTEEMRLFKTELHKIGIVKSKAYEHF